MDNALAAAAAVVAFLLFIVAAMFFARREHPASAQHIGPADDGIEPTNHTVERTSAWSISNLMLTWARQAIGAKPVDDRSEPGQPDLPTTERGVDGSKRAPNDDITPDLSNQNIDVDRPLLLDMRVPTEGPAIQIELAPVDLEGVTMADAPLVPAGDGTAIPVPTIPQLREALATGGFDRFMNWLKAFSNSSRQLEQEARHAHDDLMAVARRARNKYVLALQGFQALQADGLDSRTIARMWEALLQAQTEADAAALATRHSAQLVVACGGGQPAIASVIRALDNGHGDIARSVKAAPVRAVRRMTFYQN
ncbi:hypothetical protein [Nonomuraea endophytica]|uniref:hypothetical protein n=1 Tax=Nonomuraea endophytica TaxID=714136 RepID=UPI0037C5E552